MCKVYEIINNRISDLLEQSTVPWRKPWNAETNMPKNIISKKEYRGINIFLLATQSMTLRTGLTISRFRKKVDMSE